MHHSTLGTKLRSSSDGDVIRDADFAAEHDEVSQYGTPRYADLPGNQAVSSDADVVCYLHEVVDLGAFADDGITGRTAVDGGVGAYFYVVLDDDPAALRNLHVAGCRWKIAEAVLTNPRTGMDDDPIADQRVRDSCAGADDAIAADRNGLANGGTGRDERSRADFGIWTDDRKRIDRDPGFQSRARMDVSFRSAARRAKQR